MINFKTLDLNLLKTLNLLLELQSVSKTADKLNLSQPSVSVQLAKLREAFNDPLLINDAKSMRLTALAMQIQEPLATALLNLENAINLNEKFNPEDVEITWNIAISDYVAFFVIQNLVQELNIHFPKITLRIHHLTPKNIKQQLQNKDIDLAFHIDEEIPEKLRYQFLFQEKYVLVANTQHPFLEKIKKLNTLEQFSALNFGIVSLDANHFCTDVDKILKKHGLNRNIAISVPNFLLLKHLVSTTDIVALLPSMLVQKDTNLEILPVPFDIGGFNIAMIWDSSMHKDNAHIWLREKICQIVQKTTNHTV